MTTTILRGDCRAVLAGMPADSVHCCVTSPPYWGLRSYLPDDHPEKHLEIGSEPTLQEWVAVMVEVFREVRRVLRPDGTLWLNLGDAYAGSWGAQSRGGPPSDKSTLQGNGHIGGGPKISALSAVQVRAAQHRTGTGSIDRTPGLKPKDLMGQPWRVAFALQDDGWWLRQEIIWAKKNPMPESTRDRFTKAHEHVFLLAKGQWSHRTIKFLDLGEQRFHFGLNLGLDAANLGPGEFCVRLATAIFDGAQRKHNFSLPPFYAEEWKHVAQGLRGNIASGLPAVQWATAQAARLLCGDATAEQFLRELNRFKCHLTETNDLLIGGRSTELLLPPEIHANRDGTIAVHHAGKIGKIDFLHERIVVSTATTCNYYFNFDAVQEPVEGGAHARRPGAERQRAKYKTPDGWDTRTGNGGHGSFHTEGREKGQIKPEGVGRRQGPPGNPAERKMADEGSGVKNNGSFDAAMAVMPQTRNPRSVRWLSSEPFSGAHFATYPSELIRPFIMAGCPEGGTVLDPFGGSGTTAIEADRQHKSAILIDLDERNVPMATDRVTGDAGLFAEVSS